MFGTVLGIAEIAAGIVESWACEAAAQADFFACSEGQVFEAEWADVPFYEPS